MVYREPNSWKGKTHEEILQHMAPSVIAYANWYCENGLYLPEQYEDDPATWTQVLRYIQATFEIILDGYPIKAEEHAMYQKGLDLFYAHFKDLWR